MVPFKELDVLLEGQSSENMVGFFPYWFEKSVWKKFQVQLNLKYLGVFLSSFLF